MEKTKRLMAILAAVLLVMVMTTAAYAEESTYDVWIETTDTTGSENELQVFVYSDGTATDGVLQVKYDPSVVTASADSVTATDRVDLYSANVAEEGTLLISWLTKEGADDGQLFGVSFDVEQTGADPALGMIGTANNVDGKPLRVGEKAAAPAPENTAAPGTATPTATASATAASGTSVPSTGDDTALAFWAVTAAVCTVCCALAAWLYIRRPRRTDR